MDRELSFDAEQLLAMPVKERVRMCRQQSERAQELADTAEPKYRADYSEIAKRWLELAEDMERDAQEMEESK